MTTLVNLASFFTLNSVAVVGASTTPGKIGNAVLKNIISSGFKGEIYPINPKTAKLEKIKCYSSLTAVNQTIDLAIVAVPAQYCLDIVTEAAGLGIKNLVVLTAGFKEVGTAGLALEKKLVAIANQNNINMLGPNCVGIMDTVIPVNASFSAAFPKKGGIAFISQSGALLVSMVDHSLATSLGFSKVISLGNKAQLNEAALITALADDPHTNVILAYIEDVSNGDQFLQATQQASQKKPVIILKSGTSQAGAQAASSHTGALAGSDLAYQIAFKQSGIIRAHTMTELFDLAMAFAYQPLPTGNRVAVVTNAGGPGIIATDTIENHDLTMSRFTKETIADFQSKLPPEANIYNPVDVLGDAQADRYHLALDQVLVDENTDCVVVLICPTAVTDPVAIAHTIVKLHQKYPHKPLMTSFMGGPALAAGVKIVSDAGIPNYPFPEPAIYSLSKMVQYAQSKKTIIVHQETPPTTGIDQRAVKTIFNEVIKDGRHVLLGSETCTVAEAYGISAAPIKLATTAREAVRLADEMGYPVVMKIASPKILHKTDVGGILIGPNSQDEVRAGFIQIMESVQRYLPNVVPYGIEVQKMMPTGIEIIIGMTKDIQFGPMIAFGLGGIYVNLIQDVSFRLAKGLTTTAIKAMITDTKAYTLLKGYRGAKPADLAAVIDIIGRAAQLVTDFPEITEMDINPVFVYEKGTSALDIKITIS